MRIHLFRFVAAAFLLAAAQQSFAADSFEVRVRQSEERIRAKILAQTPPGTSKQSVLEFIEKRLRHDGQPDVRPFGARVRSHVSHSEEGYIGVSCIDELEVGDYVDWKNFLFTTYVFVSWGFDADDRLIDVVVYKETDSL